MAKGDPFYVNLSISTFDDEKILIIDSLPDRDAVILIFVRFILLAGKSNDDGLIYIAPGLPYTDENLAAIFKRPLAVVRLAIEILQRLQMLEIQENGYWYLPNFQKWQNNAGLAKIKAQSQKRQKRYRDNVKLKKQEQLLMKEGVAENAEQ